MQDQQEINPVVSTNDESTQNESLEHHSLTSANEENVTSAPDSEVAEIDNSEAVHASEDGTIAAESKTNDAQAVSSDNDIPEWGLKDKPAYEKYLKRMAEKEKEAEAARIAALQNKVAYYENIEQAKNYQSDPQENENAIIDPYTGRVIDTATPEGFLRLNELKLEYAKMERGKKEFENTKLKQTAALVAKIEEAKFKYKDYDDVVVNNGHKFTQQILDFAEMMTDNSSKNNDSGADFLYYLAKNQQELERVGRLNPYEQYQMLLKHAMEFGKKTQKVSKAPEPAQPLKRGGITAETSKSNSANEYSKDVMRSRYCKS